MKTIKELNSKWYWRLAKVLYFGVISLIFVGSSMGFYYLFQTYNPVDLIKIDKDITEMKDTLSNFNNEYKSSYIQKDKIIKSKQLIFDIMLGVTLGKSIEGVTFDEKWRIKSDETSCEHGRQVYLSGGEYDLNYFQCDMESIKIIVDTTNLIPNDWKESSYGIENAYYKWYGKYPKKEYLGFNGWLKIGASIAGVFIGILLFTLILRGIVYYIILGKISPDE